MKVFKVYPDSCWYDDYDACIVVAESEEAVRSHIRYEKEFNGIAAYITFDSDQCHFNGSQGKIHIEEIDLMKEDMILSSYVAG